MSILNVEHLTHGFGDRAIFSDVSFRLLKGEHIGLVGANGEGKSTFMNIVTGKLTPDEGKVEWSKNVHAGYLDQHAVLKKGIGYRTVHKIRCLYSDSVHRQFQAFQRRPYLRTLHKGSIFRNITTAPMYPYEISRRKNRYKKNEYHTYNRNNSFRPFRKDHIQQNL